MTEPHAAAAATGLSSVGTRTRIGLSATLWLLLLLGDVVLATLGFSTLYKIVARWPVRGQVRGGPLAAVEETRAGLAVAKLWYVKRAMCLPTAFATTCYLRCRGVPAELVIGVQKMPFRAHAWAEHAGTPVDEKSAVVARYKVIARLTPRSV